MATSFSVWVQSTASGTLSVNILHLQPPLFRMRKAAHRLRCTFGMHLA